MTKKKQKPKAINLNFYLRGVQLIQDSVQMLLEPALDAVATPAAQQTEEDIVMSKVVNAAAKSMKQLGFQMPQPTFSQMPPYAYAIIVSPQQYENLGKPTLGAKLIVIIGVEQQ